MAIAFFAGRGRAVQRRLDESRRLLQWEEDALALVNISKLRAQVRDLGGSVVVEQCPLELKQQVEVWDADPQALEVMRRLKQQFDPLRTLNPGRFAGRL